MKPTREQVSNDDWSLITRSKNAYLKTRPSPSVSIGASDLIRLIELADRYVVKRGSYKSQRQQLMAKVDEVFGFGMTK